MKNGYQAMQENDIDKTIIDFELCTAVTRVDRGAVQDILDYLIYITLPDAVYEMKQAWEAQDFAALINSIHKLHGGVAYCGVPRLQTVLKNFEKELKLKKRSQLHKLHTWCQQVCDEVHLLEQEYQKLKNKA